MNEPQGMWWNILDTVSGIAIGIIGVLGAVFGWLSNRFAKVEARMDDMEKDFVARNQLSAMSITRLEAYHEANTHRLTAIEDCTKEINKKLDRLIERKGKRGSNE